MPADRKPPGVGWQSWVERQIAEGQARGEFDDLPGTGKPLPGLDEPRDELWWVKGKLREEEVDHLPATLAIRKEREDALARVDAAATEAEVRRILGEINHRIWYVNSRVVDGPPSTTGPVDVEAVVARWRERPRPVAPSAAEGEPVAPAAAVPEGRLRRWTRRWWRRP